MWEGVEDRTELQYIDPHSYGRQRCVFLVLQGSSTGGPGAQISAGWWHSLLYLITNWSPKLHRGSRGPFGRVWLSLPHLLSDILDPQLSGFLSWPSYIIVQRPLNRPLNLWNGMFDRHQVEITVMELRGNSLPVHQTMSVSCDFYLVPFRQPISASVISFDYWPLGCVTSFRCITLEWHVWPGRRSKYNISMISGN